MSSKSTANGKPTKAQIVSAMAQRTGLHRETIKDLMKHGWHYEEQADTGRKQFFN